jgi:hypothetical protein
LEQELRQIVRELRLHEALEDKIMQQGFSVSLANENWSQHGSPSGNSATGRARRPR